MRCAALKTQRAWRDLARLPEVADEIVWLEDKELIQSVDYLVLCGLWLTESGNQGKKLLLGRSEKGLATLLVPRFKAGDLAPFFDAPSAITLRPGDFEGIIWEDGKTYGIPGVSILKTSLHAGKWATATGVGQVVLCYRPHAAAGPIVVCTAAVTGRPPGVKVEAQRGLFQRIANEALSLAEKTRRRVHKASSGGTETISQYEDLDVFLRHSGDQGAALLLTLIACGGDRKADIKAVARKTLGVDLSEEIVESELSLLPETCLEEVRSALRKFGWGAYVRLLQEKIESGENR